MNKHALAAINEARVKLNRKGHSVYAATRTLAVLGVEFDAAKADQAAQEFFDASFDLQRLIQDNGGKFGQRGELVLQ